MDTISSNNPGSETDPIAEARTFLGDGSEYLDIDGLLKALLDCRKLSHPDRLSSEELKKEGTIRFQRAHELIEALRSKYQRQIVKNSQSSLAIHQDSSQELIHLLNLNAAEQKIHNLKSEIEDLRNKNETLNENLKSNQKEDRILELEKLRKMYQPSRSGIVGVAVTVLLAGLLGGITQVDKIAAILKQYSPLSPGTFNTGVFFFCTAALTITGYKYLKHLEYRHMIRQVCTTTFASGFLSYANKDRMDFRRHLGQSFVKEFGVRDDDDDDDDDDDRYHMSEFASWIMDHEDELNGIDIKDFQDKLKSTKKVCSRFVHYFKPRRDDESFNEHTVLQYLEQYYFLSRSSVRLDHPVSKVGAIFLHLPHRLRKASRFTLGLFTDEVMDHLKDAFILHLIDRDLVDEPKAGGLVHRFRIR